VRTRVLKRVQPARLLAVHSKVPPAMRLLLLKQKENAVGSLADNELHVADTDISDHHAIITYKRGCYFVADSKSVSGTYLNGHRIDRQQPLAHRDILRFGATSSYRFIDPDALLRQRRRLIFHGTAAAMVVIAAVIAHAERWDGGLLSPTRVADAAAVLDALVSSKPADMPRAAEPTIYFNSAPAPTIAQAEPLKPSPATLKIAAPSASPAIARVPSQSRGWLDLLNHYRAMSALGALSENSELSTNMAAHTHYLLANFTQNIRDGGSIPQAYDEDPSRPGYSAKGAAQAHNSQLAWGCSSFDAGRQIDRWIASPFHRMAMLNPGIAEASFGSASDGGCWVAALRLPPPAERVIAYPHPIEFPPSGNVISLGWRDFESPDPLSSCAGYDASAVGLPLTLQLGYLYDTKLSAHSLTRDGRPVEHCTFDAHTYVNPNSYTQEYGRWQLHRAGAIVIVPRSPLQDGRYEVSITSNARTYNWTVQVAEPR
jgi:uncharacterized protein YkwD